MPPSPRQGSSLQQPGLGPVVSTALRGLSALTDRLTDAALAVAPADASPGAVRVAVSAGMVLLALSFVKSVLSVSARPPLLLLFLVAWRLLALHPLPPSSSALCQHTKQCSHH